MWNLINVEWRHVQLQLPNTNDKIVLIDYEEFASRRTEETEVFPHTNYTRSINNEGIVFQYQKSGVSASNMDLNIFIIFIAIIYFNAGL